MKILLVEDEIPISRFIEKKVYEILNEEPDIHHSYDVEDALIRLEKGSYDLCLLDLNLNDDDGFDVLNRFKDRDFETIIISANTDRALKAFEYSVLDFVPKPFDDMRLKQAFEKYFEKKHISKDAKQYLSTRKSGKNIVLDISNIEFFKAADIYVEAHLRDGTIELLDRTMEQLENLLKSNFLRIHRSYLVEISEVSDFYHAGGGTYRLHLKSGKELPVSRSKYKTVQALFH